MNKMFYFIFPLLHNIEMFVNVALSGRLSATKALINSACRKSDYHA